MRTYNISFGADIRAYCTVDIRARSSRMAAALAKAKFLGLWAAADIDDFDTQ
jgi:hypothetical protein